MSEPTSLLHFRSKQAGEPWREAYGYREGPRGMWEVVHIDSGAHYGLAICEHHAGLFAAALNAEVNSIYADNARRRQAEGWPLI